MIICNIKLNKKAVFKTVLGIMFVVCITLCIIGAYIIFTSKTENEFNNSTNCMPEQKEVAEILPENYTNILQSVHKNIDTYIGQKISFSGYIYRAQGFKENQFVLARDMDIGNNQTLIVGFLCEYEKAVSLQSKEWVKITGEITKGDYNNSTIPIVNITSLEKIPEPENKTVPVPDDEYLPTAVIY